MLQSTKFSSSLAAFCKPLQGRRVWAVGVRGALGWHMGPALGSGVHIPVYSCASSGASSVQVTDSIAEFVVVRSSCMAWPSAPYF